MTSGHRLARAMLSQESLGCTADSSLPPLLAEDNTFVTTALTSEAKSEAKGSPSRKAQLPSSQKPILWFSHLPYWEEGIFQDINTVLFPCSGRNSTARYSAAFQKPH